MKDDRVGVPALSREVLREQVVGALRIGPRKTEDRVVIRTYRMGHDRRGNRHDNPRYDDNAAVSDAPASETQHRSQPSSKPTDNAPAREPGQP
jgi:hypothetical protein